MADNTGALPLNEVPITATRLTNPKVTTVTPIPSDSARLHFQSAVPKGDPCCDDSGPHSVPETGAKPG